MLFDSFGGISGLGSPSVRPGCRELACTRQHRPHHEHLPEAPRGVADTLRAGHEGVQGVERVRERVVTDLKRIRG